MPGHTLFDPLLGEAGAEAMVALCRRFGAYRTYAEERAEIDLGDGLAQRYDAAANFVRTGGRFGRKEEPPAVLAARTNYFRESYAYGDDVLIDGIEPFLHHEGFLQAARELHDRPVIVPSIVYANLLLPGQELAIHTDVPEFRGANRVRLPQWLLVAMHHSGLFDEWRMPIATAVAYFGPGGVGGEFAFYPDGPDGPPATIDARHDTAVLLDTDTVFHGVDRVGGADAEVARLRPGMTLVPVDGDDWEVRDGHEVVARYAWSDLRFSVSWKAYCFADDHERATWSDHSDDLTLDAVLERLVADLTQRGVIDARPPDRELGPLLIDSYIRFPEPA